MLETIIYREDIIISMVSRRKIYGASVSPRYRIKMFDYLGRGGRIPATLVMEAVDAMDETRARNYGRYQSAYEVEFAKYLNAYNVPNIQRGIGRAIVFKFLKYCDRFNVQDVGARTEIMDFFIKQHGLEDTHPLVDALRAFAAKEATETEGEATGGEHPK